MQEFTPEQVAARVEAALAPEFEFDSLPPELEEAFRNSADAEKVQRWLASRMKARKTSSVPHTPAKNAAQRRKAKRKASRAGAKAARR